MKRIFKYEIQVEDTQTVKAPQGAQWLSVQAQYEKPCLWAFVDDDAPPDNYTVSTRGTGHDAIGMKAEHFLGTYQLHGGQLVFHVFVR